MKLKFFASVFAVVSLSACGGGGGGSSTPPANNAASTTVSVLNGPGDPAAGVTVTLSTDYTNGAPSGTIISTGTTDAAGQVTFTSLPSTGIICVTATKGSGNGGEFDRTHGCAEPLPATISLDFNG